MLLLSSPGGGGSMTGLYFNFLNLMLNVKRYSTPTVSFCQAYCTLLGRTYRNDKKTAVARHLNFEFSTDP